MATVTMTLDPGDQLTNKQMQEIQEASQKPIKYTDDVPELTDKELAEFKPVRAKNITQVKD